MIRRPPRSTQSRSSAASDVYKRQLLRHREGRGREVPRLAGVRGAVSYTHLRAHETKANLVCRLLLEKKKKENQKNNKKGQPKKSTNKETEHGKENKTEN